VDIALLGAEEQPAAIVLSTFVYVLDNADWLDDLLWEMLIHNVQFRLNPQPFGQACYSFGLAVPDAGVSQ
jgi:hypothetical protein